MGSWNDSGLRSLSYKRFRSHPARSKIALDFFESPARYSALCFLTRTWSRHRFLNRIFDLGDLDEVERRLSRNNEFGYLNWAAPRSSHGEREGRLGLIRRSKPLRILRGKHQSARGRSSARRWKVG